MWLVPRFAIAPLGLTTEGSTKVKLKGWKWYLKKLQCRLYFLLWTKIFSLKIIVSRSRHLWECTPARTTLGVPAGLEACTASPRGRTQPPLWTRPSWTSSSPPSWACRRRSRRRSRRRPAGRRCRRPRRWPRGWAASGRCRDPIASARRAPGRGAFAAGRLAPEQAPAVWAPPLQVRTWCALLRTLRNAALQHDYSQIILPKISNLEIMPGVKVLEFLPALIKIVRVVALSFPHPHARLTNHSYATLQHKCCQRNGYSCAVRFSDRIVPLTHYRPAMPFGNRKI